MATLYTYLVGWDETLDVKVGISASPYRWEQFRARGARLYELHATEDRARRGELERTLLDALRSMMMLEPAFPIKGQARAQLGSTCAGFTETFHAICLAGYLDALAVCGRIMREHPVGMSAGTMHALMHGRTDVRTYVDHQSPCAHNSLISDAHARIRRWMEVERQNGECPTHAGQWADACAGCAADRKAGTA